MSMPQWTEEERTLIQRAGLDPTRFDPNDTSGGPNDRMRYAAAIAPIRQQEQREAVMRTISNRRDTTPGPAPKERGEQ